MQYHDRAAQLLPERSQRLAVLADMLDPLPTIRRNQPKIVDENHAQPPSLQVPTQSSAPDLRCCERGLSVQQKRHAAHSIPPLVHSVPVVLIQQIWTLDELHRYIADVRQHAINEHLSLHL